MIEHVIIWDIETIPDLRGFAAAKGLVGKSDDEIRAQMGDKFPKLIYHSIVCVGALIAHREDEHWVVAELDAPNIGEQSEKEIIAGFVDRIAELTPQLVTFNGSSFNLSVLRYRAIVRAVSAPGLRVRPYFNRHLEDAIDLCDVLSTFSAQNKPTLHELCCLMGLPGKSDGISGADVEDYYRAARLDEISAHCEIDIVSTYRVWLRYQQFLGRLSENGVRMSEANLSEFIKSCSDIKPHLLLDIQREDEKIPSEDELEMEFFNQIFVPDLPDS